MSFNDLVSLFFVTGFVSFTIFVILMGLRGIFPDKKDYE